MGMHRLEHLPVDRGREHTLEPAGLPEAPLVLKPRQRMSQERVLRELVALGYENLPEVGGRGELVCSCEPDLIIDGLGCCDQYTAHRLAGAGLIRPVVRGAVGERVRAELTIAGRKALGAAA